MTAALAEQLAMAEARGAGGVESPALLTAREAKGGDSLRAPAAGGPAQSTARAASPAKSPLTTKTTAELIAESEARIAACWQLLARATLILEAAHVAR